MVDDICRICGKELRLLPYVCSYCGQSFCVDHRLPEKHDCKEMAKVKETARIIFQAEELRIIQAVMRKDSQKPRNPFQIFSEWIKRKKR